MWNEAKSCLSFESIAKHRDFNFLKWLYQLCPLWSLAKSHSNLTSYVPITRCIQILTQKNHSKITRLLNPHPSYHKNTNAQHSSRLLMPISLPKFFKSSCIHQSWKRTTLQCHHHISPQDEIRKARGEKKNTQHFFGEPIFWTNSQIEKISPKWPTANIGDQGCWSPNEWHRRIFRRRRVSSRSLGQPESGCFVEVESPKPTIPGDSKWPFWDGYPPKFNMAPENYDWKTILSYWESNFSGAMLNFGRVSDLFKGQMTSN